MPRFLKNKQIRQSMCSRLKELIEDHLKMSIKEVSEMLGYANTTVLRRVWKGEVFPDTEKLVALAKLKNKDGSIPNIHWLITGQGPPLIPNKREKNKIYTQLNNIVSSLPAAKVESLLNLLAD